ncbi:MAG: hypothetical protein LIO46_02770 [Clostridiales bacterium]|nr:hypothetical protein [Clostridiales bacterium]
MLFAHQATLSLHFEQDLAKAAEQGRLVSLPCCALFNPWMALLHYHLQNGELFAPGGPVIPLCWNMLKQT